MSSHQELLSYCKRVVDSSTPEDIAISERPDIVAKFAFFVNLLKKPLQARSLSDADHSLEDTLGCHILVCKEVLKNTADENTAEILRDLVIAFKLEAELCKLCMSEKKIFDRMVKAIETDASTEELTVIVSLD